MVRFRFSKGLNREPDPKNVKLHIQSGSSSCALNAILPLVASGQPYEAHQKTRTFTSRYSKSGQYDTAIDMLFQSARELLKVSQHCPAGDQDLHHYIGELLYKDGAFDAAEPHFLASGKRDSARSLANMMIEWSAAGGALGNFALRGTLPYLQNGNIVGARTFISQFIAQLAVLTCQRANGEKNKVIRESWVRLCGTYQSKGGVLATREVQMTLQEIATLYFATPPPRTQPDNPLGAMISSMLGDSLTHPSLTIGSNLFEPGSKRFGFEPWFRTGPGHYYHQSSHDSPALSVEIRASYELGRMLGGGEVVGRLQMSWDELLNHGDEPFNLSFPPVRGVHPSLKLKVAIVHACDDQDDILFDSLVDCEIARDTDAGHAQFAKYVRHKRVSHLKRAVDHFQLVLDRCPVSHPDHATVLTNLAWAHLEGYIQNDLQDIDATTSLLRDTLVLRPQPHPDHPLSLYNLTQALTWRHNKKGTAADIWEAAQLYHELLPLCPEGTYLRSIAAGENGVDYVIGGCNNLPIDPSDEPIHLRRVILELCPLGHQLRPGALDRLAQAVEARFDQHGSINDLDMSIQFGREAVSLCPEGHADCGTYLNNLAFSLMSRFDHQGKPHDLDEAISLHEEALRLCPVGHKFHHNSLDNLGGILVDRFNKCGDIDDITRAINLYWEALVLCPPGHPRRDTTLNNLALALNTRYDKTHVSEDLNEAIDLYCESLRRIIQASNWAVAAEQHGDGSALEAYSTFLELLDAHLATRSSATSQREAAAAFQYARSLPVDAASCAICRDNLSRAVELVEQGHGQQWSLASRLRTPVKDLESANPTLARNYLELSKRVSNAAQSSATITDRATADLEETEYRRLTRQWEATVAEIRDLPVFSWFLLPPLYEDLRAATHQGPVIILVASEYSYSAIIVPMSGDPHHVPLPSVTLSDLTNLKDRFARAIRDSSWMNPGESRTDLIVLSQILWDQIMLPIVNVLEHVLKLKRRSRIWLCPTAAFTSIPLHAAHLFQTKADRSGKEPCLEDLYICSYTPTLSALIYGKQDSRARFITVTLPIINPQSEMDKPVFLPGTWREKT
ncbi:hypothetical protein EV424DRAFT_1558581 [Suillus variegatus]|nr:hypothetical protein EV424DRAFT_1558581 [Suillus variegatus]